MKITKNEKGFSLVEILAAITIIGILSAIGIVGVTKYTEQAKQKDFDALAKSSYSAFEEYQMTHPRVTKINLEDLLDDEYINNLTDPSNKSNDCSGSVEYEEDTTSSIKTGVYKVNLCCQTYQKTYTYPEGTVEQITDTSICSVINPEPTTEPSVEPSPSTSPTTPPSNYIRCTPGTYLPSELKRCRKCRSGYYCPGGRFKYSRIKDQGIHNCPKSYSNSEPGSSRVLECYMNVAVNHYVPEKYSASSIHCKANYIKEAHIVHYGNTSKCRRKPTTITCEAGKFLPKEKKTCAICESGYYCPGGTWTYSSTENQGLNNCPSGYSQSEVGSSKEDQCFMNVSKNHYVEKEKDSSSTKCSKGYIKEAHTVYYGNTSKCDIKRTFDHIELMRVYYIKYKNKDCTKPKPIRRYTYHAYSCQCDVNDANIFIGKLHKEPYEVNFHEGEDMVIYYNNNQNGINSCENKNGYYINQNVKEVCKNGEFDYAGNDSAYLHGYKWYKHQEGPDVMYHKFQSAWAHSKGKFDDRYKTGADIDNTESERRAACKHACKLFSGEY